MARVPSIGLWGSLLLELSISSGCFLVGYEDQAEPVRPPFMHTPPTGSDDAGSDQPPDAGHVDAAPDAESPMDAAVFTDAGLEDAGLEDAGDASIDSGDLDSGLDAEAGDLDADVPADAGGEDAGPAEDAGAPDSGEPDSGAQTDAGAEPDAGNPTGPAPSCDWLTQSMCTLSCPDLPYCSPQCQPLLTTCTADCRGTSHCVPVCNAVTLIECMFDCRETGRCAPLCKNWGHCTTDCRDSDRCNEIRCEGSLTFPTRCKTYCDGATSCAFASCWGDAPEVLASGYGTKTCNGPNGSEIRCGYTSCTQ